MELDASMSVRRCNIMEKVLSISSESEVVVLNDCIYLGMEESTTKYWKMAIGSYWNKSQKPLILPITEMANHSEHWSHSIWNEKCILTRTQISKIFNSLPQRIWKQNLTLSFKQLNELCFGKLLPKLTPGLLSHQLIWAL